MNLWVKELEPKIRRFYEEEVGNSADLDVFKITENNECEIQKGDGSKTIIPRRIIDTYETDENARQALLKKLREFKIPESI